jgi:RINT-1 / TIP-1 family
MFTFLQKTLSRQVFQRIFKQFALDLQSYFWEWIVTAHRFSAPGGILFARDMYAFWDACGKFISRPEQYMKRLHDAVVLLSLPSSVGVTTVEGGITLATVTKRLRDTDESDTAKATELKNWLAENLEVKTLGLAEVLYMYISADVSDFQCKETAGVPLVAVVCGFVLLICQVPVTFRISNKYSYTMIVLLVERIET